MGLLNQLIHSTDTFLFHYNRFWNKNILRKLIAALCLINIVSILPDLTEIYSTNGLINENIIHNYVAGHQPLLSWLTLPLAKIGIPGDTALLIVLSLYFLSLFFIIIGYGKLIFSIIAWFLHLALVNSSYFFSYGADYFISFALFINIFFCISIPNNKAMENAVSSFAIRLVQLHLCVVYFFAGFGKLLGTDWFDGNAIWYVIQTYSPKMANAFAPLTNWPILFMIPCWLVLLVELMYPVLVWFNATRKATIAMTILLHIGIAIVIGLWTFAAIMILLNLIGFGYSFSPLKAFGNKPLLLFKKTNLIPKQT